MLDCDLQENMQGGSGVVITIGRKYGSGGKEIGQRLAQRLGMVQTGVFDKPYRGRLLPHLIYLLQRETFERLPEGIRHEPA